MGQIKVRSRDIKSILIDPETKTLSEILLNVEDIYSNASSVMQCQNVELLSLYRSTDGSPGVSILLNEDDLIDKRFFNGVAKFKLKGFSESMTGKAIIVSIKGDRFMDFEFGEKTVADRITWI